MISHVNLHKVEVGVVRDRMWFATLFLLLVFRCVFPAHAEGVAPPFKLVDSYGQRLIPNGLGMRFFQGAWDYIDNSGSFPVTVTDKAFINVERDYATPYRVLVEAPRYVLLALLWAPDKAGSIKVPWTSFVVVTLRDPRGADPYSAGSQMAHYSCGHESMDGGDHAFSWSSEKLMQVFRDSQCFADIDSKAARAFENWSGSRYQRR